MDIFLKILALLAGLAILVKGADFLVDGASGVARKLKISEIIIGMTIVVLGTCAPEIFVALQAFSGGDTDLILGDVVGCAIVDIFLLLGISAIIRPVRIKKDTVDVQIPFYLFLITVFILLIAFAFITDGEINRIGGIILIILYLVSLFLSLFIPKYRTKKKNKASKVSKRKVIKKERKTWVYVLFLLGGLAAVVGGSDLVVSSARELAVIAGISERVIAIGIVSIGTALPELTAAIIASKKGDQDLIIGSSLGSNIFDICIVLGIPILLFGGINIMNFNILDLLMVSAAAVILFFFTIKDHKISRKEGWVMVGIFVLYYVVTFLWT